MIALLALLLAMTPSADLVAEVGPTEASTAELRRLGAELVERTPRVVLWRIADAKTAVATGRFIAVFRDGPKLRVPAGGVVVWLTVPADAWLAETQLVLEKSLGGGALLIRSAPGAPTLSLAAALAKDPRVKAASPNWWLRASRK